MGHGHTHAHDHAQARGPDRVRRSLSAALVFTLVFMVVELVAGWIANSLALMSDATHMLADSGAMCVSLFAYWLARRPSTRTMSYGFHRAEILGALFSGLLIWALAGVLIYEAIKRLASPPEVQGPMVVAVAAVGLVVNVVNMVILGHAKEENLNVRAAYLHVFGDLLGSVGALVSGAVLIGTGWRPIDPIVTLLVAALVLVSSGRLVWEAVGVLMESTPKGVDAEAVHRDLAAIQGVREIHDLHVWTVGSNRHALSVHLISPDADEAISRANEMLKTRYGILHTTIQVEHPDRFRREGCFDCVSE